MAATSASSAMEKAAEAAAISIDKGTERSLESVRRTTEHSVSSIEKVTQDVIGRTGGVLNAFEKRLETFDPPDKLLAEKIGPMLEGLRGKLAELGDAVGQTAAVTGNHNRALVKLVSETSETVGGLGNLAADVKKETRELAQQSVEAGNALQGLSTSLQSLQETIAANQSAFEEHAKTTSHWGMTLRKKLETVGQRLNEFLSQVTGAEKAASGIRKPLTDGLDELQQLKKAIENATAATNKVYVNLIQAVTDLRRLVRRGEKK